MTSFAPLPSHTPPVLKWLLNERAMLCGDIQRAEDEVVRLQERIGGLRGQVEALDTTVRLLDSRVRPDTGGVVRAVEGRYESRGGLKAFVVEQLQAAGAPGIDTTTLAYLTAHRFGLQFSGKEEFSRFCVRSVTPTLKKLREDGVAERISEAAQGPYPAVWRLVSQAPTLSKLAALALASGA